VQAKKHHLGCYTWQPIIPDFPDVKEDQVDEMSDIKKLTAEDSSHIICRKGLPDHDGGIRALSPVTSVQ
jgi:hypothetical protein